MTLEENRPEWLARQGGVRLAVRRLALECGSLLPLWSAVACHRFGVGGYGGEIDSTSPPLPPQSGSKLPHSKSDLNTEEVGGLPIRIEANEVATTAPHVAGVGEQVV